MRNKIVAAAMLLCAASVAQAQEITQAHKDRARELVSQMTTSEKIDYLSGETSFSLRAVERLGIPRILLADGPQGIRNHSSNSTLYPCGILTAATWNRDLEYRLGVSLGKDARARGVGILLGPGVNIYRSPLCGRNYEYFGEDPYLTGETAKHYILGVQSMGVIATIKHFCANNQEWSRHHVSSDVDERTLNEIYFPAFRKAVVEANVGAVMDSYNLVNGVHSTENAWLNKTVLRDTWGFDGIVMSDWTSTYSTAGAANGGLDLEMPRAKFFTQEKLKLALDNGTVEERTIDAKVEHMLQTFDAFGLLDRVQKDDTLPLDSKESAQVALEVAREGIVLLKNEDGILPLKGVTAVTGSTAGMVTTGGGSGFVSPYSSVSVAEGMKTADNRTILLTDSDIYVDITGDVFADSALTVKGYLAKYYKNQKLEGEPDSTAVVSGVSSDWEYRAVGPGFPEDHFSVSWTAYYVPAADAKMRVVIGGDDGYRIAIDGKVVAGDWGNHAYSSREANVEVEAGRRYEIKVEFFDNLSSAKVDCSLMTLNESKLMNGVAAADNVVICTGFTSDVEGEGFDRPFTLTDYQNQMITAIAAANPNVVVVLNAGGGLDMSPWIDSVKGVVMAWHAGQEGGTAVAEILTGQISPSGRLPISIERQWADNPCDGSYYENTKGRECRTVEYTEGVFTGYRGYERAGVEPLFPFGFGLSYTTFEYSDMKVKAAGDDSVTVTLDVTNTGEVDAAEVVQVYVSDKEASVLRPAKELKGYAKVWLKSGEKQQVSVTLPPDAFKYYDIESRDFILERGEFEIMAGSSSADIRQSATIRL